MRKPVVAALCAGLVLSAAAEAQSLRERFRERMAERMAERQAASGPQAPATRPTQTLSYGADPLQVLDFWAAKRAAGPAPLTIG